MTITNTGIAVALAVAVALGFLFFGPSLFAPLSNAAIPNEMIMPENNANPVATIPDATELQINDVQPGTGATAEAGDTVTVEYVGALTNGSVFDASENHGQPFTFTLGAGSVIQGWEQGIVGMKEGGQRVLIIPPQLGYGPTGNGPIPGNATLLFQVQLVSVQKGN